MDTQHPSAVAGRRRALHLVQTDASEDRQRIAVGRTADRTWWDDLGRLTARHARANLSPLPRLLLESLERRATAHARTPR